MIQEEYVTEETAKLLQKVGLQHKGKLSQAQAMRWLREERNMYVMVDARDTALSGIGIKPLFRYRVYVKMYKYARELRRDYYSGLENVQSIHFNIDTYEEAVEGWNNVYSSSTLRCEDSGPVIKVKKLFTNNIK